MASQNYGNISLVDCQVIYEEHTSHVHVLAVEVNHVMLCGRVYRESVKKFPCFTNELEEQDNESCQEDERNWAAMLDER
jgi:hypothetical protein